METDTVENVVDLETKTDSSPQRGPGRPPVITLQVVKKVAQFIAKGMTEEQACLRVGVNHASLRTARHRNAEFETAIKEAQAAFLDESLDIIAKGQRGWQGRAWILERRHGEQFRRNTGLELNGYIAPFSVTDLLARKPLERWSRSDVEQSVGAWRLLRQLSTEQLEQLIERYKQEWGPADQWTDEQLARLGDANPADLRSQGGKGHDRRSFGSRWALQPPRRE